VKSFSLILLFPLLVTRITYITGMLVLPALHQLLASVVVIVHICSRSPLC